MYKGIFWLPSIIISQLRRTLKLLATFLLILGCSWSLSCCDTGTKPTLYAGTWTGYLSMGGNDNGYNTITVSSDRTCCLIAEISGNRPDWGGSYTLRIEGAPELDSSGFILGEITITRFRTGVDTTQTTGTWSGAFILSTKVASGGWNSIAGGAFICSGEWMATRQ
jgi:hypothetical protein